MTQQNSLLSKLKWRVASRLPGPQSWDKMKLVNKGLSPLNQNGSETRMPQTPNNPFLRTAWLRAFERAGVNAPEMKSSSWKFAAAPWQSLGTIWKSLRGSGAGSRSVSDMAKQFGKRGLDPNTHLGKLFRESAEGGAYNGMTHQIGPAFGRAMGGSYIGHQFDSDDENATPWGSILGGVAGLSSPVAVRKLLGNPNTRKGSLRRLFADRTISRRIANDPLNRVMLSAATGNLLDMGAGALGYETGGWGERIGIMGGLAGGSRPIMQALGSRYKPLGNAMTSLGKTRTGQAFHKAQSGGFSYLPSYLLGSPYATGSGAAATAGMVSHGILDSTVGERVRNLAEKKKMISGTLDAPEMQPVKNMVEQTLQQIHGPQARFYDPDGTPSKEAIELMRHLGDYGMMQLRNAGHNYFGNSGYMFDPNNWQRLSSPISAFGDFARGQATKITGSLTNNARDDRV